MAAERAWRAFMLASLAWCLAELGGIAMASAQGEASYSGIGPLRLAGLAPLAIAEPAKRAGVHPPLMMAGTGEAEGRGL